MRRQQRPHERVAVGVEPRRRDPDEDVAGLARAPGRRGRARSTMPTQKPARSNSSGAIRPGCSAVSPPTRAQPASSQPSAMPPTSSATSRGLDPPDREVVEEEERPGAVADHVVGAHRHQVAADGVEAAAWRRAIAVFVPTPSVALTSTGLADARRQRHAPRRSRPGRRAARRRRACRSTCARSSSTARSPAVDVHAGRGVGASLDRHRASRGRRPSPAIAQRRRRPALGILEHELVRGDVVRARAPGTGRRSRRSRTARAAGRSRPARRRSRGRRANRRRRTRGSPRASCARR